MGAMSNGVEAVSKKNRTMNPGVEISGICIIIIWIWLVQPGDEPS